MRLSDVIRMAGDYLEAGIIAAVLFVGIICAGYFVVVKKMLHKTVRIPWKKMAAAAAVFCYLSVVFSATMLDRGSIWENTGFILQPFASYRAAWNGFRVREWRNIILNICMFVPLGLLLPLCGVWWRKCYRTYLAGFLLTLMIELVQFVSKRGIFELDDIFNNLLGTMIGYGIYRLFRFFYDKVIIKMEHPAPVLVFQVPLLFAAAFFGTIFTVYHMREFGNLQEQYVYKADMSKTVLRLQTELSAEKAFAPVYQMHVADKTETHQMAQDLFERLGTEIDEERNDYYDDTVIYRSTDDRYSVWIDYAGSFMNYRDFSESFPGEGEAAAPGCGLDRKEIESELECLGVQLPDETVFKETGEGTYVFEADQTSGEVLRKGMLSCTCNEHGKIVSFNNTVAAYRKYRECEIYSQQEAFERLSEGKFRSGLYAGLSSDEPGVIEIEAVQLVYRADSKGFYQPVYEFSGSADGEKADILIPALK